MALRFVDSFDHYDDAHLAAKYPLLTGQVSISTGRFGNGLFINGFDSRWVQKIFDDQATWIIGFAFQFTQTGNNNGALCELHDTGTRQCELFWQNNRLHVKRQGTTVASGSTVLSDNTWYHIQFKVTIGNSAAFEVKLNDITEISGTGDTQSTANAFANRVLIGGSAGAFTMNGFYDDLYICDGSGGVNDDFLGDCRVEALFPNGNGNSSQFDGSDGNSTDNYLLVDETTAGPDGDTTYVTSTDVGDKDTYAFTNMTSLTGVVFGVQTTPYARKTDAGSRTIVSVARLSATEVDSSADSVLDGYKYFPKVYQTKPGGGTWAIPDVNSAEFGFKVNT